MAAISRATPSFAPPATQNTAPVHEFRCLYTHDVRKKAKKWHDGSARFHTFNKRVMVYDDTKNYIGDLHYRADEALGEGTELQLDRGVLVEIGERTGETHTDLTGILHTSHTNLDSQSVQPVSVRAHTSQRAHGLNSQGRPKSLVELLGTSQGRLGRARLAFSSPFEQRQVLAEVQHVEPPTKKQKVVSGKENSCLVNQLDKEKLPADHAAATTYKTKQATGEDIRASDQVQEFSRSSKHPQACRATVVEISSDEDMEPEPRPLSKRCQMVDYTAAVSKQIRRNDVHRNPKHRKGDVTLRNSSKSQMAAPAKSVELRTSVSANRVSTASVAQSSIALRPGMGLLRMRPQQPRRKLLYKTLLPLGVQDRGTETIVSEVREPNGTSGIRHEQLSVPIGASEDDNLDHIFELDELDDFDTPGPAPHLEKSPAPSKVQDTPQRPVTESEIVRDSPLFMTQISHCPTTPARLPVDDDFDATVFGDSAKDDEAVTNDVTMVYEAETDANLVDSEPDSPCFPPPPPSKPLRQVAQPTELPFGKAHSITAEDVRIEAQRTGPTAPKARLLTRSLSTNDPPLPFDPRAISSKCLANTTLEPALKSVQNPPSAIAPSLPPAHVAGPNNRNPSRSPFQRSRSDTAASIVLPAPVTAIPAATITSLLPLTTAATATPEEQGPWTTIEAFLLFDKWPTCKEKYKPQFENSSLQKAVTMTDSDGDGNEDSDDDDNDNDAVDLSVSRSLAKRNRALHPPVAAAAMMIRSARSVLREHEEDHGRF